jgi:hypothetical protein
MAHNSNVQTVVETHSYLALARKFFSESEMSEIVAMVAADAKCGELMRKTGGFRKVRAGLAIGARAVERVLSTSTGTKAFPSSSLLSSRRTRKPTSQKGNATSLRSVRMTFDTYRR